MPKAAIGFITLVGGAIASIGVFFIVVGIGEWRDGEASRSWPVVEGRVILSRLATHTTRAGSGSSGASTSTFHEIRYEYLVDDVHHKAGRVSFKVAMGEGDARTRAAAYPEGAIVAVHVDPEDPDRAVLEPGADGWNAVPIAIGGVAVLFPAAVVTFAWRLCRRLGVL